MGTLTDLEDLRSEAVAWYLRLRSGDDADWDAFVLWLERDPAHADAYDAVVAADADLSPDVIPPAADPIAANDEAPRWSDRWRWIAAVAAIALVAVVLMIMPRNDRPTSLYTVATAAGEHRSVALDDGTSVVLNGGSRLVLDRANPRHAEMAQGEALFTVRHDSARPFVVIAGDHRLQDAGTVFNVINDPGSLRLDVVEGAVIYDPAGRAVRVEAGHALRVHGDEWEISRRAPGEMASWRRGRLTYRNAMLDIVAADLARNLGVEVKVDDALARMPFTGTIRIERDPAATLRSVAALSGLQARTVGEGWLIEQNAHRSD